MPAQQYIGLHKNVIKQMMKSENNELYLDESTINKTYKYLKYVDALGQQTLLYFLDEDDKCKLIRYMCDYSLLNEQIERLDQSYTKKDENSWQYKEDGEIYEISLEEKDWYFVITTSKK
jgi:hypothetical protein